MSRGERKAMIVPSRPGLSLTRQCRLLSISRSSFYYAPRAASPENLALMRRIDELFLKYPFYGSRQMMRQLRREGVPGSHFGADSQIGSREVVRHPARMLSVI